MFALKHLIVFTEEIGLDERFLKLLFFDVSQIGKTEICDSLLPFFDLGRFTVDMTCSFPTSPLFITGYCLFSYQVLITFVGILCHRYSKKQHISLDFMLVVEEVSAILIVIVGSCYELPYDLILLSGSMYLFNSSQRMSLESLT